MKKEIARPKAEGPRINTRNEFELCYIRHQYFRRSTYNPSKEEMTPYLDIIKRKAKKTYFFNQPLFNSVGFEEDDLFNIGMIHLVSFLGLFSMEMMPDKYSDYVEKFMLGHVDPPEESDVLSKNQANFTLFLKQRMKEVVRICTQKIRNIKGVSVDEYQPFYGTKKPPTNIDKLLNNYAEYGFRKLDMATFKTIKRRAKAHKKIAFRYEGMWYIAIPLKHKTLDRVDYSGAGLDPHDNIHNMNPEEIFFLKEDESVFSKQRIAFKSKSNDEQARIIRRFIRKEKNNLLLTEEIKTAKRVLARITKNA